MKGRTKNEKKARKLYLHAERLWKEYAFLRDGRECKVKKYYPNLHISHTDIFQVDHGITRQDHHLFFEPSNATVICSTCNLMKKRHQCGVDRAVDEIIIDREGLEKFNEMKALHLSGQPNHEWGKIHWLEYIVDKLEAKVEPLRPKIFRCKP